MSHEMLLKSQLPKHGVAKSSCSEKLKYFSVVENYVFDPTHDLLEGVVGKEMKLVLKHLVYTCKVITVANINNRIATFSYGLIESKNKPSSNFSEQMLKNEQDWSIKQKAAQSWCLIRHFPLIFRDLFDEDDPYLEMILFLLQILEIVFAEKIVVGQIALLESLIFQHHILYKQLFPHVSMMNKHHHMVHYPTCIRMFGPMSRMSCMRHEAKHNFFKKHAHMICNFRNICKSLAFKHQLHQCYHFSKCTDFSDHLQVGNRCDEDLSQFPFFFDS